MTGKDAMKAFIGLVCGDPLLELQANAIDTLSNTQIPGANTWLKVIDRLNDFLAPIDKDYDMIFLDCNPSFSIYTQIALATVDRLVLPVRADDSSRRLKVTDGKPNVTMPWWEPLDAPPAKRSAAMFGMCRKLDVVSGPKRSRRVLALDTEAG